MRDQWLLLTNGIPAEIFIVLLIIFLGTIFSLVLAWKIKPESGETILKATGIALSLMGLLVSGYVLYKVKILGQIPQCVGGGGGCALVEGSSYSEILGIHVSLLGVIGYLLILGFSFFQKDFSRTTAFFLTLGGFSFSLYLTYLELWKIFGICQWCVASATIMTCLFIVSSIRLFLFYGRDQEINVS